MSLLTPLYLLGLAAVSLPVLLHLIRRSPRGRQVFSALMFLEPSPPRITRRSRIEHWLLLLLRAAALTLLALAFTRPFLREAAQLSLAHLRGRRVALVVDVSASIRRGSLWRQVQDRAGHWLTGLEPGDDVALLTFDRATRVVAPFEELPPAELPRKVQLVRDQLRQLEPGWDGSNLGGALADAADLLAVRQQAHDDMAAQIVLLSDLQQSARLDALHTIDWPDGVAVAIETLDLSATANAAARVLEPSDDESGGGAATTVAVRIANAPDADAGQLSVQWGLGDRRLGEPHSTYVAPGHTRVVRVPAPTDSAADRIVLSGDEGDFDNVFFTTRAAPRQVRVVYFGGQQPDDAEGLPYYLRAAVNDAPPRTASVVQRPPADELSWAESERPDLLVVAAALNAPQAAAVQHYVAAGGTVLVVPEDQAAVTAIPLLFPDLRRTEDARAPRDYWMLADIDFQHPCFSVFANSRFSDFTPIRFWKRWPLEVAPAALPAGAAEATAEPAPATDAASHVIARFDSGEPAVWERRVGQGRLVGLASSWRPADSQLALSTKFVPFVQRLLDLATGASDHLPQSAIGEPVPIERPAAAATVVVTHPDGSRTELPPGVNDFHGALVPGVYRVQLGDQERQFAVNVAATESDTAPLDAGRLEQFGLTLGKAATRAEQLQSRRQQRDLELEGRQKLWRWLILIVFLILLAETALAGLRSRRASVS